jgi:hypothetical protein
MQKGARDMDNLDFGGSSDPPGPSPSFPDVNRDGIHDTRDVGTMWHLWNQTQPYSQDSYHGNGGTGNVGAIILVIFIVIGLFVLFSVF